MTRVKVCGLTRGNDVRAAVAAGAHAVGVVVDVSVETPREVPAERAATLFDAVPPFASTVLVTMPTTPDAAVDLARRLSPDVVQVHGGMAPGDLAYLGGQTDADVVAAVDATDPARARQVDDVADAVLVDSADEAGAGGTGRTHDWTRTRGLARELDSPVVLAGGLTPENVADAVRTVDPFAVDVASGVEAAPGRKDHEAVARFVERASRRRVVP